MRRATPRADRPISIELNEGDMDRLLVFAGARLRAALAVLVGSIWIPPRNVRRQPLPDKAQVETRFGFGHHAALHSEDRVVGVWSRIYWPEWNSERD